MSEEKQRKSSHIKNFFLEPNNYRFVDQKGTLESLLKEIVYKDNDDLFVDIEKFYNKHFDKSKLQRLQIREVSDKLIEQRESESQKEYPLKAKINIAGQLQNSGVSQVVTIDKSDLITLEKLQNNKKIQEIIDFLQR
jgi:hypothetical protein